MVVEAEGIHVVGGGNKEAGALIVSGEGGEEAEERGRWGRGGRSCGRGEVEVEGRLEPSVEESNGEEAGGMVEDVVGVEVVDEVKGWINKDGERGRVLGGVTAEGKEGWGGGDGGTQEHVESMDGTKMGNLGFEVGGKGRRWGGGREGRCYTHLKPPWVMCLRQ